MIDHVSIGVSNLDTATTFYASILSVLGFQKLMESPGTVGFGKKYPEFWLNFRQELAAPNADNGCHICFRAPSQEIVNKFYALSLELGARDIGAPGFRPEYHESYYACFIRDSDENHVEVVTFVQASTASQ
jgi:catechol 2,3-dioxygenase-like lactoylglutathione lyase family enzyme